jgi:hypothetical protein
VCVCVGVGARMSREIVRGHPDKGHGVFLSHSISFTDGSGESTVHPHAVATPFGSFPGLRPIMSLAILAGRQGLCTLVPENNPSFPTCKWISTDGGEMRTRRKRSTMCICANPQIDPSCNFYEGKGCIG